MFVFHIEKERINGVNGYTFADDKEQEFINSKKVGSDREKCQKENRKANSMDEVITRVCTLEHRNSFLTCNRFQIFRGENQLQAWWCDSGSIQNRKYRTMPIIHNKKIMVVTYFTQRIALWNILFVGARLQLGCDRTTSKSYQFHWQWLLFTIPSWRQMIVLQSQISKILQESIHCTSFPQLLESMARLVVELVVWF